MENLFSGIRSKTAPIGSSRLKLETARQTNSQNASKANPTLAVQGVPGEYDFRKFLTPQLENLVPVHYKTGGSVVGSLAATTNSNQWRDAEYDPGRYGGFFSPAGEYASPPVSVTIAGQEVLTFPQVEVLPTKAVTVQKSTAKAFSVNVLQTTDPA